MEFDSDLKRVYRTTIIINGALVASLFLYALMVELIRSQFKPFPGLLVSGLRHQTLRYLFFGAAVGAVVLVRLAGRTLLKVTPGEDHHHLISRLSRTAVITSALGELPAVLGFVLFLLTGFSRDFYLLLFVSLFLEFMYFPRLKVWQDLARERFPQRGI
jgi:F0F1-type ATP synthase membrane subunit c/vacuolar-type H+-ATPase subunit K